MSSPQGIGSGNQQAYSSLMQGLQELDLRGTAVPDSLYLIGENAFPLAMNSRGQVLMAASVCGRGRMVVLGHESYLTTFPLLVENALTWLRGDGSENYLVGIHQSCKPVADNLTESIFHGQVVEGFGQDLGVGVYVVNAYSMAPDVKSLVDFLKAGGGLLIAGQAWSWGGEHPKEKVIQAFPGNKMTSMAGIYFSGRYGDKECLSVFPPIPGCWNPDPINFAEELAFLLEGVSEYTLNNASSEIQVHGHLAFPISPFIAGAYYGRGRVICVTHEALFSQQDFVPLWLNALRWLDQGREGVVGVEPSMADLPSMYGPSGLSCQNTELTDELSVFVCMAYCEKKAQELHDFVMEGGGLLIGGHAWYWSYCHPELNLLTDFAGTATILRSVHRNVKPCRVCTGLYTAPNPDEAFVDHYHFHRMVSRFTRYVVRGEALTAKEEGFLAQLRRDCAIYLLMAANESASYRQVVSNLTDIVKKGAVPQVSVSRPVSSAVDRLLLTIGEALYECLDPDSLLPYLMRDNSSMPVVQHHPLNVDANTADQEEWISTGLYLSPGMKTYISLPEQIVNKGWKVQIGCQVDCLDRLKELWRAPCVHKTFRITTPMVQVWNLWGGLLYLVAPPNTQVEGPAPWAELEYDNIIHTMPSSAIRDLERPDEVAMLWDDIMRAIADLACVPHKFPRKERFVVDVQISHGYPIMMLSSVGHELLDTEAARKHGMWGFIHELGAQPTEGLLGVCAAHHRVHLQPVAHPSLKPECRLSQIEDYIKGGKDLNSWNTWTALETYLQLQEAFGWGAFKTVFTAYHDMANVPKDNEGKMNLYAKTFSVAVEKNLCAFFKAWGWPIEGATEEELSSLPLWSDHPMILYG
ncbi:hypothetical protein CRUP_025463 [Coryphaenoides rupestris]|nr:hypothetical protein CRUP_025463 [Coryphaenoides rupestris]